MVKQNRIADCLKYTRYLIKVIKFTTEVKKKREIEKGGKNISRGENAKKCYPWRCTFVLTSCNSNGANQFHTEEVQVKLQTYQIARKYLSHYVRG